MKGFWAALVFALPLSASLITTPIQGTANLGSGGNDKDSRITDGDGTDIRLSSSGSFGVVGCFTDVPCQLFGIVGGSTQGGEGGLSGTYRGQFLDPLPGQSGADFFTGTVLFGSGTKIGLTKAAPVNVTGQYQLQLPTSSPGVFESATLELAGRGTLNLSVVQQNSDGQWIVDTNEATFTGTLTETPEPASVGLSVLGLLGLCVAGLRHLRRAQVRVGTAAPVLEP